MTNAPVCPKHPDRQTWISCTRCGRPVCYECMVSAPVGFQCKECVAQAAGSAPVYTSQQTFQQPAGVAAAAARPVVTYVLLAINIAAFLLALMGGVEVAAGQFGMRPAFIALDNEWYRFVTSAFLHWTILHIGFNMLVLFMIGPPLERLLGHTRFLVLYLLAAIGGSVASYCFSPITTASVGASGAIFGLMAALIVAGRSLRYDVTQVIILLGINLVIGFLPGGNIDWRAHLGGLIVGALVAAVFAYAPKKSRIGWQIGGCLIIVAILAAMVSWRTESIRSQYLNPGTSATRSTETPVLPERRASGTLEWLTPVHLKDRNQEQI